MDMYLVKFACTKDDEPKFYLLDDRKMDDWILGDSGIEGYHLFETIWYGDIEAAYTQLNDFRDRCIHTEDKRYSGLQ